MTENIKRSAVLLLSVALILGATLLVVEFALEILSGFGLLLSLKWAFWTAGLVAIFGLIGSVIFAVAFIVAEALLSFGFPRRLRDGLLAGAFIFFGLLPWIFEYFKSQFARVLGSYEAAAIVGAELVAALIILAVSVLLVRSKIGEKLSDRISGAGVVGPTIGLLLILALFMISRTEFGSSGDDGVGSAPLAKSDKPNVLLIIMDTARADHFSLNGYPKKTSPYLEELAAESTVYENAFSISSWTLASHASLFSGYYPTQNQANREHLWLYSSFKTLAEYFAEDGYQTVSFSNNTYVGPLANTIQGFERNWLIGKWLEDRPRAGTIGARLISFVEWGLDRFAIHLMTNQFEFRLKDATTTNAAIYKWFGEWFKPAKPFFMFINYMDVHNPYDPPDEFARKFLDEEDNRTSYDKKLRWSNHKFVADAGYTPKDIAILNALYDAEIAYLDSELRNLTDHLKAQGLYENTVIVITSDHGEFLGERGRFFHGFSLHDPVTHIPMIIRYPEKFTPGKREEHVVSLLDVHYTLLDVAGIADDKPAKPAYQLLHSVDPERRPQIFSEEYHSLNMTSTKRWSTNNIKYMVEFKSIRDNNYRYLWRSRGEDEFYNEIEDPLEAENLYSTETTNAGIYKGRLDSWFKGLEMPTASADSGGASQVEIDQQMNTLRALGYIK